MRSTTNLHQEEFFKKFCSDWKKAQFWCPYIMGEYDERGDEYGKRYKQRKDRQCSKRNADGQILGVGFWRNRGEVDYDSTSSVL